MRINTWFEYLYIGGGARRTNSQGMWYDTINRIRIHNAAYKQRYRSNLKLSYIEWLRQLAERKINAQA